MTTWVQGVDVSIYQGKMNWEVTKTKVKVALIRLGIGIVKDINFEENYLGAKDADINLVSVYHAFHPLISPTEQSEFVNDTLAGKKIDFHFWSDVEINSEINPFAYGYRLAKYMEGINQKKGIYTRGAWWNSHIGKAYPYDWSKFRLFIARYNSFISHPWLDNPVTKPYPWDNYVIWQYSADGNWKGAEYGASSNHIDLDRVKLWYYNYWYGKKLLSKPFKIFTS